MKIISDEGLARLKNSFLEFRQSKPFNHIVIDNFLEGDLIEKIEEEFPEFEDRFWKEANDFVEIKKTQNNWNLFPPAIYETFSYFCQSKFVHLLSQSLGFESQEDSLIADYGLHGGGLHMHGTWGSLNPHIDYNVHPKIDFIRKLNIIIYVSKSMTEEYGGHFGIWKKEQGPLNGLKIQKEIWPKFNRAIIIDTTQDSWHGISKEMKLPQGIYRKSLAIYYLQKPKGPLEKRRRALFAPTEEQARDKLVKDYIEYRSNLDNSNYSRLVKK